MIESFRIDVPEGDLDDLRRRLLTTRWPGDIANEDWSYGPDESFLRDLVAYWADGYEWRAAEAEMNRLPHFRTVVDGVPIHFVHLRGTGPAPTPLLLTHGWPWTFWDFAAVIGPLTDPVSHGGTAEDAFDVVIPSLPGFAFSSPLTRPGIGVFQTVPLWAELMTRLGYDRFGVQGGDFGGVVSAGLAHAHADRVIGAHLSFPALLGGGFPTTRRDWRLEDFGPDEQDWPAHNATMAARTVSHVTAHVHDPQTLAYAFNDSPVGLAAWLLVRRRNASDCDGDLLRCYTYDQLLTTASLYWFTGTIGTSMRWYAESAAHGFVPAHDRVPEVEAPVGMAIFPGDVLRPPRAFAARHANLRRWTVMERGGHYAPAEQPEALVDDIRAFFRELRR
jgi:pimeloyl-ACP methyl ester carboxylesterase